MDRRRDLCLTLDWNVENPEVKSVPWTDWRLACTHTHTQMRTLSEISQININTKVYVALLINLLQSADDHVSCYHVIDVNDV